VSAAEIGFNRGMRLSSRSRFALVAVLAPLVFAPPALAAPAGASPHGQAGDETGAAPTIPPSASEARRKAIDDLFARLRKAEDSERAAPLRAVILGLWEKSGSPTADLLMSRAETLLKSGDGPLSAALLDRLVALYPDWTSAWRRRAQSALLQGDSEGAMLDLDRALAIEPRDFLAMTELATLLRAEGRNGPALELMRRALELDPQNDELKQRTEKLSRQVEGDPI
jgi:tetratricopeptide (TPR) repeat protein